MDWNLLYQLSRCEFRLRDQGTFFGFLWALASPTVMFVVIFMIFSKWFGRFIPHFGWHLIIGLVQWNLFSAASTNAVTAFERRKSLVKYFSFNKILLPISSVISASVVHILESLLVLSVFIFMRMPSFTSVTLYVMFVALNFILALGVGLGLSYLHVFFRDIGRIWGVLIRIGFFVTPIFYPLQFIQPKKLFVLKLNPLYHILNFTRDGLLLGKAPAWPDLGYIGICLIVVWAAAWSIHRKCADWVPESI